ncbi:MAG: HD domain-containing protein [Clostridia bacterium]|nr:HD domain-containing protein [Clostridia bacterium]
MLTFEDIIKDDEINTIIKTADRQLVEMGYTEHGYRHLGIVSRIAGEILTELGYSERIIELGKIAGYMHDIGNSINREDHAHTGALLAYNLLTKKGMSCEDAAEVMMAIGNHDEKTGNPVSPISAALIIADKSDVHRTRVRAGDESSRFDIHDRVNYAVEDANILIDKDNKKVVLQLKIDTKICPVIKYFEIFLDRMLMSKKAANYLNVWFGLEINGATLL